MDKLLDVPIQFWSCHKCLDEGKKPIVSWVGSVATCELCGATNREPIGMAAYSHLSGSAMNDGAFA